MRRSICISISCMLVCLSAGLVLADPEPGTVQRVDSLFANLEYASFEWVKAEGVSDRAAMRVPVDLAGKKGWFQFDTGLDVTLVYGDTPSTRGWETHEGMYRVPSLELGGIRLGARWLCCREEIGGEGELIGSIGLDLLVGHLVLIDYPGRRLALMKPGEAPLWLLQHTTWTPAELRDAKFFMTVVLGEGTLTGLFFDTGASAFDITVDLDKWAELTGCSGPDDATTQLKITSWGNEITAVGCPARGPLVIGSARIENPLVFYLKEQPNLFGGWPFRASGLVGNAPFWDRIVIMDLGIRPRFGVVQ